jgi:hypothetical protein
MILVKDFPVISVKEIEIGRKGQPRYTENDNKESVE